MRTPRERRRAVQRLGKLVEGVEREKPSDAEREYFHFAAQSIRDDLQHEAISMHGMELRWNTRTRAVARTLMRELHARAGVRACRECGCTQERGCSVQAGCSWVSGDLCSACVPGPKRRRPR